MTVALGSIFVGLLAALVGADATAPEGPVPPAILISRQLSTRAHVSVGDEIALLVDATGTREARFRVAGIYEPTPDPMKFNVERLEARVHLPDLVALTTDSANPLAAESVTTINVTLVDPADTERFGEDVSRRSLGLLVRPTSRPREGDPFAVLDRFHTAIAAVTVIGSTAFLLALMLIRAEERREIVGVLRLIGVSERTILLEVIAEGVVVAMMGAVFGVALAAAAQYGINAFFQARYDTTLVFVSVTPSIALRSVAVALPLGILAGVVASWKLLRQRPAALVRR